MSPCRTCNAVIMAGPAVSVLSIRGPKLTLLYPSSDDVLISCCDRPPSGPHKIHVDVLLIPMLFRPCVAPGSSTSRVLAVTSFIALSSGVNWWILGNRFLPLCSHALMAIWFQRCCFLPIRFLFKFADRWQITGMISVTPSSVAFCMLMSICSLRDRPCIRLMLSGDSRLLAVKLLIMTLADLGSSSSSVAENSPPSPLNRVTMELFLHLNTRTRWFEASADRVSVSPMLMLLLRYIRVIRNAAVMSSVCARFRALPGTG